MKFVIERAALLDALTSTDKVVARRNTIPVLDHVLVEANGKDKVRITGTDMDRSVEVELAAQVRKAGSTTVNAVVLLAFTRATAEGCQIEAELDQADGAALLILRAGRARAKLPTLPADQFPKVKPADDQATEISVDGARLTEALKRVEHAQSNEETRYYLNGVYLYSHGGTPRLVATDGYRMAWSALKMEGRIEVSLPGVIIPRQSVSTLHALAADADQPLVLAVSENQVRVVSGNVTFATRLVDGTFPDYERVIPKDNESGFQVDQQAFLAAINRCSAIGTAEKNAKGGKALRLTMMKGALHIRQSDQDGGEIEDEVDASLLGKESVTGFNSAYMAAAIGALGATTLEVEFTPGGPIVLRDPAAIDEQLQIVMAMRTSP